MKGWVSSPCPVCHERVYSRWRLTLKLKQIRHLLTHWRKPRVIKTVEREEKRREGRRGGTDRMRSQKIIWAAIGMELERHASDPDDPCKNCQKIVEMMEKIILEL